MQFVDAFERVVKSDNRAVAHVSFDVVEYVFGSHPFRVIARNYVPHHHFIFSAEPGILRPAHPPVWWAEQVRVYQLVGAIGIVGVSVYRVLETADVVVGVVAHAMACFNDLLIQFGMLFYVLAYHKEGGTNVVMGKCFKDKGGRLGDGTVVEGEINAALMLIHSP